MHDVRFSGEDILARQLELADANYRRLREKRIRSVSVNGKPLRSFDAARETITLRPVAARLTVRAQF